MSKTSKRPAIAMPTAARDRAITAAAKPDPDAQPLTPKQLKAMFPLRTLRGRPKSESPKRPHDGQLGTNTRLAVPEDIPACLVLRGQTRENAISAERLATLGITAASWASDVRSGVLTGFVCTNGEAIVGYCFGDNADGEVVVLALLPAFEQRGIGRHLLGLVVKHLGDAGHRRLFLGCTADPAKRSHGFYRHLGWASTGTFDHAGDEVLERFP